MDCGQQSTPLALSNGALPFSGAHRLSAVRGWRALPADRRLAIIEESLARSGVADGYPLAL